MKYFAFSDAHGDYVSLMTGIQKSGYEMDNKEHQLISVGDNFGRAEKGDGSLGIFNYLRSEKHAKQPICIRGNHESIFLEALKRDYFTYNDIMNGEDKTFTSFSKYSLQALQSSNISLLPFDWNPVIKWIESMPWYFETTNYIFTHGWIPFEDAYPTDLSEISAEEWDDSTWAKTPYDVQRHKFYYPSGYKKTIVVGHWTSSDFWGLEGIDSNDQYFSKEYKFAILDQCTKLSNRCEVHCFED